LFFDLAVELADAEPWRRRAVWEGARDGAPHWWSAHREDLAQALDVET
jgi:hypothetical protein